MCFLDSATSVDFQVVLRAENGTHGAHLKLTKLNASLLPEISYEQPIFIPLEEPLKTWFDELFLIPPGKAVVRVVNIKFLELDEIPQNLQVSLPCIFQEDTNLRPLETNPI